MSDQDGGEYIGEYETKWKEPHEFDALTQDECLCGLPKDSPLHGGMSERGGCEVNKKHPDYHQRNCDTQKTVEEEKLTPKCGHGITLGKCPWCEKENATTEEGWERGFSDTFPDGLYDCLPDKEVGETHAPINQFERVKTFIRKVSAASYKRGKDEMSLKMQKLADDSVEDIKEAYERGQKHGFGVDRKRVKAEGAAARDAELREKIEQIINEWKEPEFSWERRDALQQYMVETFKKILALFPASTPKE